MSEYPPQNPGMLWYPPQLWPVASPPVAHAELESMSEETPRRSGTTRLYGRPFDDNGAIQFEPVSAHADLIAEIMKLAEIRNGSPNAFYLQADRVIRLAAIRARGMR